jgi:hypothetical protein
MSRGRVGGRFGSSIELQYGGGHPLLRPGRSHLPVGKGFGLVMPLRSLGRGYGPLGPH